MDDSNTVEAAYVELSIPVETQVVPPVECTPVVLNTTTPVHLEELEFVKYQLGLARFQKAQLLVDMYRRELSRAEVDSAEAGRSLGQHTAAMAEKYSVDLRAMMVSDDGYFMPRPKQ